MRSVRIRLFVACLLAAIPAGTHSLQEPPSGTAQPNPNQPFSIGERLVYLVKWDPPWYLFFLPHMEAGEVDLQLVGETEYKNKKALKIILKAHSSGMLMKMSGMKVEDEFIFLSEPETFCSLRVSQKIREGKRKRQVDIDYLRETRRLHIRVMDESVVPPKLQKDEIKENIPPCVQDPFSALYTFRMSELRLQHVQTFMIGNDDKFKEVQARVEKQEVLDTSLGKLAAWNVDTSALKEGLFKEGGQFRIWFSADERKLPLQFEVKVSLGRVLGKLISVENQPHIS
ncbi:MAG: DUF3108 domain-containing protein [Acidobacteria bacterium]|nr:DUF3108 domain-containing protein [Acidobacteriota bacterium]